MVLLLVKKRRNKTSNFDQLPFPVAKRSPYNLLLHSNTKVPKMGGWYIHNVMKLFLKLYSTMLLLIFHKRIVYHYFNHQVHSFISWCIFKIKMKMLTNESRHFFFINDLETRFACFFLNAFKIREGM